MYPALRRAFLFLLLLGGIGLAPAVAAGGGEKTVYIMRHLPQTEGTDPGLTANAVAQAQGMAKLLGKAKIKAIFVTNSRRSRETAAALAEKRKLTPTVYDPSKPEQLVDAVRALRGNVLIVGHSNTVHDLVGRFGGEAPAPLAHGDFGTIWKIGGKKTSTLTIGSGR